MGYDRKLVFTECFRASGGAPQTIFNRDTRPAEAWGLVVATVDLCGVGGQVGAVLDAAIRAEKDRIAEDPNTYGFGFYYDDGNTFTVKDRYDDPVAPVDLMVLRKALRAEIEESREAGERPYRRYTVALALIEEFVNIQSWPDHNGYPSITCLHFGH